MVAHLGFRSGGYAEFALASAQSLHSVDAGASFSQAVATIGTGRTAQLVWESANIRPTTSSSSPVHRAAWEVSSSSWRFRSGRLSSPPTAAGEAPCGAHGERFADGRLLPLDYGRDVAEQMAERLDGAQPSVLIDGVGGATGRTAPRLSPAVPAS
ncbi:hypothetical protein JM654_16840 [Microbacterium oxydans]|nr:hypothetical protein [Microbacterium oxydans]